MELTKRERFTRCAFGQDIDMLPIQCDFSGSGLRLLASRVTRSTWTLISPVFVLNT